MTFIIDHNLMHLQEARFGDTAVTLGLRIMIFRDVISDSHEAAMISYVTIVLEGAKCAEDSCHCTLNVIDRIKNMTSKFRSLERPFSRYLNQQK